MPVFCEPTAQTSTQQVTCHTTVEEKGNRDGNGSLTTSRQSRTVLGVKQELKERFGISNLIAGFSTFCNGM